jgi:Ni,Fe-hydrogenase III small subunit
LVSAVLVVESLLIFGVPSGEAAKYVNVDMAPIHFLQKNEGQYRFFDFAVLTPNWGSQYGLNELNAIDLPFPQKFSNLIENQLAPGLTPSNQFVIHDGVTGMDIEMHDIVTHFKAYEDASVKYLMMPKALVILPALTTLGVTQVFTDSIATIYEMPSPRPFISTRSSSCTVTSTNDDAASVSCPNGGSTLIRTELSMAGWKAFVNGKSATIKTVDGVYQSVKVPQGTSSVTYAFLPPHEKYAVLLALLAALFLVATWVLERRSRWSKTPTDQTVE